jgi:hypothetical protein
MAVLKAKKEPEMYAGGEPWRGRGVGSQPPRLTSSVSQPVSPRPQFAC